LASSVGTVVALTDSSGNIVNQYKYDSYGNVITATEQVSNPFRFTGAIWDSSTGLYKMGERYYDPTIGRFVTPDPLDGQDYTYAGNNPINAIDPSGLVESIGAESGGNAESPTAPPPGEGEGGLGEPAPGEETQAQREARVLKTPAKDLNKADRQLRAKLLRQRQKARNARPPHTKNARPSTHGKHTKPRPGRRGKKRLNY
jgi:RHS repeat-associated protein